MAEAPAAFLVNNNNARLVEDERPDVQRLQRRLSFYGIVYSMLGASFLLRAAVPPAHEAVIGFPMWMAAVVLMALSFQVHRFPLAARAAARLAQAALTAFFN